MLTHSFARNWRQPDRISLSSAQERTRTTPKSAADQYLHDLLSDVAGEELHRNGVQLSVNCREIDRPYELQGDELTIHPELFQTLQSKEEMAFVLGQQAAFAMKNRSSDGLQFGADRTAVKMMAEAGLNPSGALGALEKLYQKYPTLPDGEGLELAMKTVASGQEHEGVRTAVVQLEVEQMRRAGHPATKKPVTSLPSLELPEVFGDSPSLELKANAGAMIEAACDRLSGESHSTRLDGLLRTVLESAEKGLLRNQGLSSQTQERVEQLLGDSPVQGLADQNSDIHREFLERLMGSTSLRGLAHPLEAPWRKLVDGLVAKRGRFGLPDGMILVNRLIEDGVEVQVPEGLASVRDQMVTERLSFPYKNPQEIDGVLDQVYQSESWAPFGEDLKKEMPEILLNVARSAAMFPDFHHCVGEPEPLHPKLEWQFQQILANPDLAAADKQAVKSFLNAHWDCDKGQRANSAGERRAQFMAKHYTDPATVLASEASLANLQQDIQSGLKAVYHLADDDLTSTDTEALKALRDRIDSGTDESKLHGLPLGSRGDQRRARRGQKKIKNDLNNRLKFVAAAESKQFFAPLAYLAESPADRKAFLEKLDEESFKQLLAKGEASRERVQVLHQLAGEESFEEHVGIGVGKTMLESWMAVQSQVKDLDEWYDLTSRSIAFCSPALEATGGRRILGAELSERMSKLQPQERSEFLRRRYVGHLLNRDQTVGILLDEVDPSPESSIQELAQKVQSLDQEFQLRKSQPGVYKMLRNEISKRANLQPGNVETVFPPDTRDNLEVADDLRTPIAGLSALVALTREQSPKVQLATIEYVMGRTKSAPGFLQELTDAQGFLPATEIIKNVREELKSADVGMRMLVADSFLAGPSGLLRKEGGRESLLRHFTQDIRSKDLELVSRLAGAILDSQGDADSLAVAAILAQPSRGDGKVSQSQMLSSFFDAYGVPGIKMKQYLAFTTEFDEHSEAFASAQDNAKPVNHFQALKLLKDRFDGQWPEHLRVEKVLGNGSVNVAVRCFNEETEAVEIVSMNRRDIEQVARYDFERFQKLFENLTKTPEDKEKFGFVLGLMKIVKDSVELEFDKEASMAVQQKAFQTYNHEVDGWKIQSIDAYRAESQGLFMAEAQGKTARKIKQQNPELYKEAMTAMHKVEMGVLKGQGSQGKILPEALFANPDFHDGQVLISSQDKSVTILDFGQAVPITNDERETALDLMTVFAKVDSPKAAVKRLNKRFFKDAPAAEKLTVEDLESVLERKKDMGRFIRLLSTLALKGAEVPMSGIHWILALNRQIVLGKRLGSNVENQVKSMILGHKLGLRMGVSNTITAAVQGVANFTSSIIPTIFPPKALEQGLAGL